MSGEVRYERLRPAQIRAARQACPVLYLPIGTLEWHGLHNPVGLDTLKIHALCVRCAQAHGGLVFPPLWYGEAREEALIDSSPEHRDGVCEAMGLDPELLAPGHMRRSPAEVAHAYHQLLLHLLNQGRSLGFKVLVIGAGHYPLLDHARAAAAIFHQQRYAQDGRRHDLPIAWVFTGYELVQDIYPFAGDHAAMWETSLLMALDPDMVDLSLLPADKEKPLVGVGGARPPHEASAQFGEEAVGHIVARVGRQVLDRLNHPERYRGHGLRL